MSGAEASQSKRSPSDQPVRASAAAAPSSARAVPARAKRSEDAKKSVSAKAEKQAGGRAKAVPAKKAAKGDTATSATTKATKTSKAAARSGSGSGRSKDPDRTSPGAAPVHLDPIEINRERELVRQGRAIVTRLSQDPELMKLLIINPVLAFKDAGIKLSPAVGNHVLHAIQYPPAVRAERDALEAQLHDALGSPARPTDPTWLASTLFDRLGVTPLVIGDHQPTYQSSTDAESLTRLEALLPTRGVRTVPSSATAPTPPAVGRWAFDPTPVTLLDLESPVPELDSAPSPPADLALVDLWFYKDSHPLAKPLLSLGILTVSGLAIYSSGEYRRIRKGQVTNQLVSWISSLRIPAGTT